MTFDVLELLHIMDLVVFVSIALLTVDIVVLYVILAVIGKQYALFGPWRVLLQGLIGYCGLLFLSDAWWFLAEVADASAFYAVRQLCGRLILSGLIWYFSWSWWKSLPRGHKDAG